MTHLLAQLDQLVCNRRVSEVVFDRLDRCACIHARFVNVVDNAGALHQGDIVSDRYMVGNRALTAYNNTFTECAGTGDAGLRNDNAVFANICIVRDMA
jgi:hypothetical protein